MERQKTYTVKEATLKLMRYCAYRERSHKEVEEKLQEMRMIPAAREQIILKLMHENFLNEERFARSLARGKFTMKKWGRIKIVQHLKQQQVSVPNIRTAMKEIDPEAYYNTCLELAKKKSILLRETQKWRKRKKLVDYLLQKGFEPEIVYEVVGEAEGTGPDKDT